MFNISNPAQSRPFLLSLSPDQLDKYRQETQLRLATADALDEDTTPFKEMLVMIDSLPKHDGVTEEEAERKVQPKTPPPTLDAKTSRDVDFIARRKLALEQRADKLKEELRANGVDINDVVTPKTPPPTPPPSEWKAPEIALTVTIKGKTVAFTSNLSDREAQRILIDSKPMPGTFPQKLASQGLMTMSPTQKAWLHKLALEIRDTPPQSELKGQWIGKIGQRAQLRLKLESKTTREGQYGLQTIHHFTDVNGNAFVWFGSGESDLREGDTMSVDAGIKAHESFKGRRQTILTRVKKVVTQ